MTALKVPLGGGWGCRGCGEVFTSLAGFESHWKGYAKREGKCCPPAEAGLVQRADGKWSSLPPTGGRTWHG